MSRPTTFPGNNVLNYASFICHDVHKVNIFNTSHINVLSSLDCFYPFSFYFCEYSFFIYSFLNDIFYVNNIINILITNGT